MPETPGPPAETTAERSGCVLLLVDESRALEARVAEGTKSKSAAIATAVNSLLNRLTGGPALEVALLGYRTHNDGTAVIGSRWAGPLEGRQFVSTGQLAAAPATVEDRVRKIPDPGGFGAGSQQTVRFPVWYSPLLGGAGSKTAALQTCREMLATWLDGGGPVRKPPLVVSILGDLSPQEPIQTAVGQILQLQTPAGPPLVFHAHLGGPTRGLPTLYPSSDLHMVDAALRDLFHGASLLPDLLVAALRDAQVSVIRGARGLIHNAGMADLIRFLGMIRAYAAYQPPQETSEAASSVGRTSVRQERIEIRPTKPPLPDSPEETASTLADKQPVAPTPTDEQPVAPTLVVLLLDRAVADPEAGAENNVWARLQEHGNEILAQIARQGQGRIETALVRLGGDGSGGTEVEVGFAGTLAGPSFVRDTELTAGALRVEEVSEQVSNGIGGLVTVTRKKPIFIDLEPMPAGSVRPGLEAAAELVDDWLAENPDAAVGPIVLHLGRGECAPEDLVAGVERLRQSGRSERPTLLYHLAVTETPHRSLAYPGDASGIESDSLRAIWESSSLLLGRQRLAARRRCLSADSRGLVVNARFDLLMEGIQEALSHAPSDPDEPTAAQNQP